MISVNQAEGTENLVPCDRILVRSAAQCIEPSGLADIYSEEINISIWQRNISDDLKESVNEFLARNLSYERNSTVPAEGALNSVNNLLAPDTKPELREDIAELVEMFCYLFDLKRAGLRLAILNRAMCPRFHVDNVPCRMVTTYNGVATEWLPHQSVNRAKLGSGNDGLPDHRSGLYKNNSDIKQLKAGDVALLKGELWEGNERAGLVHRSPAPKQGERRLLLTMDYNI